MADTSYNRIIRKLVVGFGNLFNNITLVRYNPDNTEQERMIVPIIYAAKELYVKRLEEDYNLDKKVQITLPRLSFEMTGLSYDASRKQNTNWKSFVNTGKGVISQYNPVPYDFDFSLYLYVRNIEDGTQIIEHILPYFTPDYTIKLNLVPEMGVVKEIPVVLKDTNQEIIYEGNRDSGTRTIIWTLNFTVKGFIFGKTSTAGLITTSITNILNNISPADVVQFNMSTTGTGTYQVGEKVYQGFSAVNSTATAKVVAFNNNALQLTNINGNFVSSQPIYGINTNASYLFESYQLMPAQFTQIVTVSNPTDANSNVAYTYTTTVQEDVNIVKPVLSSNGFNTDLNTNVFGIDDLLSEQENPIDLGS